MANQPAQTRAETDAAWMRITASDIGMSDAQLAKIVREQFKTRIQEQTDHAAARQLAIEEYAAGSDNDVEIDIDAAFSAHDGGVWVQGWMHVSNEMLGMSDADYEDLRRNNALNDD